MKNALLLFAAVALCAVPASGQSFGSAVGVSGDQIIAGGNANAISPGALHVYTQSNDGSWVESGTIAPREGGEASDGFGRSLSISGQWMAVGAPGTNSVFFFEKGDDGSWSQVGRMQEDVDGFGGAITMQGNHLLVAATRGFRSRTPGTVHAYQWTDQGYVPRGILAPETEEQLRGFPSSMTLADGHAVIGAASANDGAGAAWAFRFDEASSAWVANGSLSVPFAGSRSGFGSTLLAVGPWLAVGMPGHDARIGSVAMFELGELAGEWNFAGRIAPFSAASGASFGRSLAHHDGVIYVGAPGAPVGAIYEFRVSADRSSIDGTVRLSATGLDDNAGFGSAIAVGEGVAVVGATGQENRSGVAVPFGKGPDGWSQGNSVYRDPAGYESLTGGVVECSDDAAGPFPCKDINMVSFLNMKDLGAERGIRTNDIWGWEDPETGREYALVGLTNQTSFVDVTDAENPIYLGKLPLTSTARTSVWRDMKVYRDHVYIVADGANQHGMQVFDLRQLRDFDGTPQTFEMTNYYDKIASAHNIVINEETGFAYSVGSSSGGETCGGGLHMIDIRDPGNPTFAGCFADGASGRRGTGYSHDAQCVVYRGPDPDYAGREICLGSNETALSIADVTDKQNPVSISVASYPNVAYAHQGWLTEDHRFFYMNDEGDEPQSLVEGTRTLIWDLEDLDEPQLAGQHIATTTETDHNLYIRGDVMYQSNYGAGFRVLDISNRTAPVEIAYFDTSPIGGGDSWSNYPYFRSGTIVVTGGSNGLFILRKKDIDL